MAWRRPEFIAYFAEHYVQLPLAKGDAVFLSPALFHAAGANRSTDVRRMANLLQISSAFGRAMEAMDREAMVNAVYPVLVERRAAGLDDAGVANVVAACAEGYAFPTDLDRDQPVDGLSPPSQADVVSTALTAGWSPEQLRASSPLTPRAERDGSAASPAGRDRRRGSSEVSLGTARRGGEAAEQGAEARVPPAGPAEHRGRSGSRAPSRGATVSLDGHRGGRVGNVPIRLAAARHTRT